MKYSFGISLMRTKTIKKIANSKKFESSERK